MAINEWWRGDASECYWMEITDRRDLGADLHAPQVDDGGRDYWSYSLVTAVQPGDVILHWHKSLLSSPGIVAYSYAVSGPTADQIEWTSQGTYGRQRPTAGPEPSWKYALAGFTMLSDPVGQEVFRRDEPALREIKRALEASHPSPLYLPFAFSDKRPIRAAQGYLVKFPTAIVQHFSELRQQLPLTTAPRDAVRRPSPAEAAAAAKRKRGSGRMADPGVRLALERHAVNWAIHYYRQQGYDVEDVGSTQPYDIKATKPGTELHIEVKGSSGNIDAVELTRNELQHARDRPTHLVVVDRIAWARLPDGAIKTAGGRVRRWESWVPNDGSLTVTRYRYELGDDIDGESVVPANSRVDQ